MDVVSALVAHLQPPEAVQPRQSPLHYPPVSAQLLPGFDAPPSYPRGYAPLPQGLAASRKVISLVGMQLVGSLARTPTRRLADRFDGIDCLFQYLGVVNVGSRVDHGQRDASPIYHNMALRALFALICRVRAGLLAPRGRPHSPRPMKPSPTLSGRLLLNGPGASDAAFPTRPPLATP